LIVESDLEFRGMAKRKNGNTLEKWEIAVVKAMLARDGYNGQPWAIR